jgi:hypothetical protein
MYRLYYIKVCHFHSYFLLGFYHEGMLHFVKGFFSASIMIRSDFLPWFYSCARLCLMICTYVTVLASLEWEQLDYGAWCFLLFSLQVFYWETLHISSSVKLVYNCVCVCVCGTGDWAQNFALARQVLYYFSHTPSPNCNPGCPPTCDSHIHLFLPVTPKKV